MDKRPQNSLALANIEHGLGKKGVYIFRARPASWDEGIIKEIASLGHEIGYHYEELSTFRGDTEKAFEAFTGRKWDGSRVSIRKSISGVNISLWSTLEGR